MVKINWVKGTVRGTYTVEVEHLHSMLVELQLDGAVILSSIPVR